MNDDDKATAAASQYLTFVLDRELFALDILCVREVLALLAVTKVPRTPDFMLGVINLRGHVVPVIDLRLKLGLTATERTVDTSVIILEVEIAGERTALGALVDAVQGVIDFTARQIAPPPPMGTRVDAACIRGIGRREDAFIPILEIDRVLNAGEIPAVSPGTMPRLESQQGVRP